MIKWILILSLISVQAKASLQDIDEALLVADVEICQVQEELIQRLDQHYESLSVLEEEYAELERQNVLGAPLIQLQKSSLQISMLSLTVGIIYQRALKGRVSVIQAAAYQLNRSTALKMAAAMAAVSSLSEGGAYLSTADLRKLRDDMLLLKNEIKQVRKMIAGCS